VVFGEEKLAKVDQARELKGENKWSRTVQLVRKIVLKEVKFLPKYSVRDKPVLN